MRGSGSGTAEVCAFVSVWGQGRFCLPWKGEANPGGQRKLDKRFAFHDAKAQFRIPQLNEMGLFFLVQMLLQPLHMLGSAILVFAVSRFHKKIWAVSYTHLTLPTT